MFRLLSGRLDVRRENEEHVVITGRKERALLVILLLHANAWVGSGRIVELLWGDEPPNSAGANLKTYIWKLRRVLPAPEQGQRIEARRGQYRILTDTAELDLSRFTELATVGRQARTNGDLASAESALTQAAELWSNESDFGADLPDRTALDGEWQWLQDTRAAVLEDLADLRLQLGRVDDAVHDMRTLIGRQPLRERAWQLLMLALYRSGRRAEALAAYQDLYRNLDDELGIAPGPQLQAVHIAMLRDDPTLSTPTEQATQPRSSLCAQLPPDLPSFTGRGGEIETLLQVAGSTGLDNVASPTVCVIDGMAGAGKTALAVHVAHRLGGRFPDGQLFIDLHGFSAGLEPVDAHDALERLLRSVGVHSEDIPADLPSRSAILRSILAGRRMLLLLDNAADEAQIRPLIPATAGCLVLITGRRRLTDLDDAYAVSLDVLPAADAVALFSQISDAHRIGLAEAVEEVVEMCGYLPLAIRIAGARLRSRPTWTLTNLADRLRDRQRRLTELSGHERSVLTALQVSYDHLTVEQKRTFRLLALVPGQDFDSAAVTALTAGDQPETERLLSELFDMHLLEERSPGRYTFHDLVRQHAADMAAADEGVPKRREAVRRWLDYLVAFGTCAADTALSPTSVEPETFVPDVTIEPGFDSAESALDWLAAERKNLVAAATHAADHGYELHSCALGHALYALFARRGYIDDWIATEKVALGAARRLDDLTRVSTKLNSLATAYARIGDGATALSYYDRSLETCRELGDRRLETRTLISSGTTALGLGQYTEALRRQRMAVSLFEDFDVTEDEQVRVLQLNGLALWRLGRYQESMHELTLARKHDLEPDSRSDRSADTHNLTGLVFSRTGPYREAIDQGRNALELYRRNANSLGQVYALNLLGRTYCQTGEYEDARQCLEEALELVRRAGARVTEALTSSLIGVAQHGLGRIGSALEFSERALALVKQSGDQGTECEILNNSGFCLFADRQWHAALGTHSQALKLAESLDDPYERAGAQHGIANTYQAIGDDDEASRYRETALSGYHSLGIPARHTGSIGELVPAPHHPTPT